MKIKEKSTCKKSKGTKVLNIIGILAAIIAIASLINNIMVFKETINQYVSQGYKYAEVIKQIIPVQLIPAVFESIGMYGGIAVLLFAAAMINEKVSKNLAILSEMQLNKEQDFDINDIQVESIDEIITEEPVKDVNEIDKVVDETTEISTD